MIGSTLYMTGCEVSTGEYIPNVNSCSMCKRLIINAGIEKVVLRLSKTEYRIVDVQKEWVENDDSLEGDGGY